jgi:hypothetical protein
MSALRAPSPPPPLLQQLTDFDRAFDHSVSLVAFVMNRHLIDHMLKVARTLTLDDYEAMIIWGVLAHQNVAHLLPPGSMPSTVLNDSGRVDLSDEGMRPLRLRDIVQICRMPRETVRRKLHLLEAERWIEQTPCGWVVSGARFEPLLREFSRDSVRRFLTAADEVMRALRAADVELSMRQEPSQSRASVTRSVAGARCPINEADD